MPVEALSPTWTPAAPASSEPYRVFARFGWEHAVEPQRIVFQGFEGWDTFSHRIDGGYRVTERLTGLAIESSGAEAKTHLTRGCAHGGAAARLGQIGPARFAEVVVNVLQKRVAQTVPAEAR